MRRLCALLLLSAFLPAPAAAQGPFCKDSDEYPAWKNSLDRTTRKKYDSLLSIHESRLESARQGNPEARYRVAHAWAICQMSHGSLGDGQLRKAVDYLGSGPEDRQRHRSTLLAHFTALGWGVRQDYQEAYRLLDASRRGAGIVRWDTLDEFVAKAGIGKADPAQQRAAYVFNDTLQELVMLRPVTDWRRIVTKRGNFEDGIPVRYAVGACPLSIKLESPPSTIDPAAAARWLQSIVNLLPPSGLPCTNDAGEPFSLVQETTLVEPDPNPFAGR